MELTHLRYFVMLATVLNFTEAARRLFITQSTLSQSIRHLEEYLGAMLFERAGRRVYLTDAGKSFLPHAQRVLEETEKGVQILRDMQGLGSGTLKVGVISGLRNILVEALEEFVKICPDVRLSLIQLSSAKELASLALEDKIDLALSYLPGEVSPLLNVERLFESEWRIMAAKNSDVARKEYISLKELENMRLVLPDKVKYVRSALDELSSRYKLNLMPDAETNDSTLLIGMVQTGQWVSIGMDRTIEQYPGVAGVRISEPTPRFTAAILSRKTAYITTAAQALMQEIINKTRTQ